ncbi:MAG: hypothetical protein ACK5II_02445 [Paracoccus sp. (in: a-proteobacteria)]
MKAIVHSHVKTDKVDAGTLASLHAAGYLPEIWTPDAVTERMRRLVGRRDLAACHRTRIKSEVHDILHVHFIPKCRMLIFSTSMAATSWLALSRFCSGLLRAMLSSKETGYGNDTQ